MSNYLCIATVTAALHEIVQQAVSSVLPGAPVRIGPPRAIKPGEPEVNLYLYQVSPNANLRNADLPRWSGDGAVLRRPQAAINLHYLVSFAGEERLATDRMLGKVVSTLHAAPVIGRQLLERLTAPGGQYEYLVDSDLAAQPDMVQLTPEYLDFEELSKLWTVFFQTAHRPSLLYMASPLLIDGPSPRTANPSRAGGSQA